MVTAGSKILVYKIASTTTFGIVCLPEGQPVGLGRVVGHGEVVGEPPEVHSVHHRRHSQALLVVAGGQAAMPRGLCEYKQNQRGLYKVVFALHFKKGKSSLYK
jgi:hypothetical protein